MLLFIMGAIIILSPVHCNDFFCEKEAALLTGDAGISLLYAVDLLWALVAVSLEKYFTFCK